MKSFLKLLSPLFILIVMSHHVYAQKSAKRDTVYYLMDTTRTPHNDQIFLNGQEGNLYGYRLTCSCYPKQTDAVFIRRIDQKGIEIAENDLNNYKLLPLRSLLNIVARFGADEIRQHEFYFIEYQNKMFIKYQVFLAVPHNQDLLNSVH